MPVSYFTLEKRLCKVSLTLSRFKSQRRYGVDTGAHRDHTVATPASTALKRDTPCWTSVHREWAPVISIFLKQPGLTGTHRDAKQSWLIPKHHRSSSGMNRISTVRTPGETVANRHELGLQLRCSDSRLSHDVPRRRAGVAPTRAGRTTVWHGSSRLLLSFLPWYVTWVLYFTINN